MDSGDTESPTTSWVAAPAIPYPPAHKKQAPSCDPVSESPLVNPWRASVQPSGHETVSMTGSVAARTIRNAARMRRTPSV
jgi:hypothetical protein